MNGEQKNKAYVVTLAVAVFFVLSGFTFMNFMYCLADCIGSVVCGSADVALRDAQRSLPIFLSFFLSLTGLMTAHTFYRNECFEILKRKAKKHAITGIVIGTVIVVYVIAMRIAGRYLSFTEGAPSLLYPLDAVLYALLFIAFGFSVLRFFKKNTCFNGPSRPLIRKKGRAVSCFFRAIWLLTALYGFCGFFFGIFILDFAESYVPYCIAILVVSLVDFLTIAVWELYYNNLTEAKRKQVTLPLGLFSLAASIAAAILYFIALKHNLDGPSNVGFGILPVSFTANVNFATLLVVAVPLIVSVTALVKGVYRRRKGV